MKKQFDFDKLKEQHVDVFNNKDIDAVGNWTQPNFDSKTDEPKFLEDAVKKIKGVGDLVDEVMADMDHTS